MKRAGKPSEAIVLSDLAYSLLKKHSQKKTISVRIKQRIEIIIKSHEGESGQTISRIVGLSDTSVYDWQKRWRAAYGSLSGFEYCSDEDLLSKMLSILGDRPRSGAPSRISKAEKEHIVALACRKPSDFGLPMSSWNGKLLAEVAMSENLVKQISASYVSKLLKKTPCSS